MFSPKIRRLYRYGQAYAPPCFFVGFFCAWGFALSHSYESDDVGDFSGVSGYYGPGAFVAWYLTALSAAIKTLQSFLDSSRRQDIEAEFIAVMGYPLVALVDICVHGIHGSHHPSFYAASTVVGTAVNLSFPVFKLTWSLEDTEHISPRTYAWAFLFNASAFGLCLSPSGPIPWLRCFNTFMRVMIVSTPGVALFQDNNSWDREITFTVFWTQLASQFGMAVIAGLSGMPGGTIGLLLPMTPSTLSDLDQATALGFAVIVFAWQWKSTWPIIVHFAWRQPVKWARLLYFKYMHRRTVIRNQV